MFLSGFYSAGVFWYSTSGAVIFSIYVLIDIQLIKERCDQEDYILASITLYIDLMQLFMHILQALGER